MSYPAAGPGSALLERLEQVPRDGRWRTTREMCELMEYSSPRGTIDALYRLVVGEVLELHEDVEWNNGYEWRRTDA